MALKSTLFFLSLLTLLSFCSPEVKLIRHRSVLNGDGSFEGSGQIEFNYFVFIKKHNYSHAEESELEARYDVTVNQFRVIKEKWYSPEYTLSLNYMTVLVTALFLYGLSYWVAAYSTFSQNTKSDCS